MGTVKDVSWAIGRTATWRPGTVGGIVIEVRIIDVKWSYGQQRAQVTPVAGSGEQWVQCDRLVLLPARDADTVAR
ncbi:MULTISPECIES: hypothetical protein [Protofrankia]|uniref:Uncharacterized protein n=1 Tax=Protofrankia coriariae TaxID=1562887 RepID=A0ABR5EZL1_9ACTN|nr:MULTISPECIES: hypothetical protein [Protofrankia]KLL09883.1 hypothetical protein FrCorBMG51_21880 [Protofrankia coriariae]ONH34207.1 hypothetical protein BL254_17600 [Protofrankia sp. BMG5.30]